mgnify:CR=1 FL=1
MRSVPQLRVHLQQLIKLPQFPLHQRSNRIKAHSRLDRQVGLYLAPYLSLKLDSISLLQDNMAGSLLLTPQRSQTSAKLQQPVIINKLLDLLSALEFSKIQQPTGQHSHQRRINNNSFYQVVFSAAQEQRSKDHFTLFRRIMILAQSHFRKQLLWTERLTIAHKLCHNLFKFRLRRPQSMKSYL